MLEEEEEEASDCVGEGSHASKKRVKSGGGRKEDVAKKKSKGKKTLKGKKLSETRLKSYGL